MIEYGATYKLRKQILRMMKECQEEFERSAKIPPPPPPRPGWRPVIKLPDYWPGKEPNPFTPQSWEEAFAHRVASKVAMGVAEEFGAHHDDDVYFMKVFMYFEQLPLKGQELLRQIWDRQVRLWTKR